MRREPTPSAIARTLAAQTWPDVQSQTKLGPGVFEFSCAGHGGIIAVLPAASFPEDAVSIARAHGRTELVVHGFRRYMTSERYTRESLAEYAERHGFPSWECWVGEEDCDWALLVVAKPELADAMAARKGYVTPKTGAEILQYARENAERWNADILAELDEIASVAA